MAGVRVVCETNEVMTSFRFARVCPSRGIPINKVKPHQQSLMLCTHHDGHVSYLAKLVLRGESFRSNFKLRGSSVLPYTLR